MQKGIAHNFQNNVVFVDLIDCFLKKKSVMVKKSDGNIICMQENIKSFIYANTKNNIAKIIKTTPIVNDKDLECCPERFLDENWDFFTKESIINEMKKVIRNIVSFEINCENYV